MAADDGFVPGTDQTLAELEAHASGPVAVADSWLEAVLGHGRYDLAWLITDPVWRLVRAQAWVWNNRFVPGIQDRDRDELAEALAGPPGSDALWESFATIEVNQYRTEWTDWNLDEMGYASRPRPVGVDYELVLFARGTEFRVYRKPTSVVSLPFLMHFVDGHWMVAHPGGDTIAMPGWPPDFPTGRESAKGV